jgi:glycine cleavage system H protein
VNSPELVNSDPYGAGWLFSVTVSALGTLISADEYEDLITE